MLAKSEQSEVSGSVSERIVAGVCCAGIACGTIMVGLIDPTKNSLLPACPLFKLTGIACPGCGATRGTHALLHGDIITALDFNLMLPVFLGFFAYLFVSQALTAWRGYGLRSNLIGTTGIYMIAGLSVAFMIARNLPWPPFNWLYP